MNDVLNHLEKAIEEMTEAAGNLIGLATAGNETAINYIEIFTSIYTELLALYGLMYAENEMNKKDVASWYPETLGSSAPNFKEFIINRFCKKE